MAFIRNDVHLYCCHCGIEMPVLAHKTTDVKESRDTYHWLVSPCLCQYDNEDLTKEFARNRSK